MRKCSRARAGFPRAGHATRVELRRCIRHADDGRDRADRGARGRLLARLRERDPASDFRRRAMGFGAQGLRAEPCSRAARAPADRRLAARAGRQRRAYAAGATDGASRDDRRGCARRVLPAHSARPMTDKQLLQLGLVGGAALIFFPQLVGWLAGKAAVGAARVIVDTGTGLVIGVGESVGIPATDAEKCAQYIAAGDHWNASFYCPAGTFIADAAGDVWDTVTGAVVGKTEPGSPAVISITPTSDAEFKAWQSETGGVLAPGETQAQAFERWRTSKMAPF